MVPFGGWDMPVEYSGITAEHMAVRTAAGPVRRLAHGRGRDRRQGRARGGAAHHVERRLEAAGRPDPVLGPDDARRHVRGRPARLPLRPVALPAGHQRRQHRQGRTRGSRRAPRKRCRRRDRQLERSLRADRHPGTEGARRSCRRSRRSICRRSSTTGSRTARSPASAARCRAPATPAKTASK